MAISVVTKNVQIKTYIVPNIHPFKEEHQGLLQYIIPKAYNVTWASIFSLIERHKNQIGIQVIVCNSPNFFVVGLSGKISKIAKIVLKR